MKLAAKTATSLLEENQLGNEIELNSLLAEFDPALPSQEPKSQKSNRYFLETEHHHEQFYVSDILKEFDDEEEIKQNT